MIYGNILIVIIYESIKDIVFEGVLYVVRNSLFMVKNITSTRKSPKSEKKWGKCWIK